MESLQDNRILHHYISQYKLSEVFSKDMSKYMVLHSFRNGEFIFKANQKIEYLYFMVEGKAKVYTLLKNGKSLLLRFYNPFTVIGDVEFMEESTVTCNVQVINSALCLGMSMENIRKHAVSDPVFLKFICKSLADKLAKNSIFSAINLLYPLENRFASYILAVAPSNRKSPGFDEIFTENLTELADLLGTSYRHLLRVINKLNLQGIIEKNNTTIRIVDRMALESLAGDLYE